MTNFADSLTFDDVLIQPAYSDILPSDVDLSTEITWGTSKGHRTIKFGIPILSAAMDDVTESLMAIALAQMGGMGVIHRNLSIEEQCKEVIKVKKHESGMVYNPVLVNKNLPVSKAIKLMDKYNISGILVIETDSTSMCGIITKRDVRFITSNNMVINNVMSKPVIKIQLKDISDASSMLHQYRIEKLPVEDEDGKLVGLITAKDIEKRKKYPNACKDGNDQLCVAAACGIGQEGQRRALDLCHAGVDVLVIDTAHGHSQGVLDAVKTIKSSCPDVLLIAGNIATAQAADALVLAGANVVKVGVGPGSICTTRIVSGIGVPQLSALLDIKGYPINFISDGGIKHSGDIVKALAAGAKLVMIGSLLSGTDESPGEVFLYQGRSYKSYRGMGSLAAMASGSADRYSQDGSQKLVPEGIEGMVPYKGSVSNVIDQLTGGIRAALGYTGNKTIADLQKNCVFTKITPASFRESHVHDVTITKESPNYSRTQD